MNLHFCDVIHCRLQSVWHDLKIRCFNSSATHGYLAIPPRQHFRIRPKQLLLACPWSNTFGTAEFWVLSFMRNYIADNTEHDQLYQYVYQSYFLGKGEDNHIVVHRIMKIMSLLEYGNFLGRRITSFSASYFCLVPTEKRSDRRSDQEVFSIYSHLFLIC
jgi:hypothetical protein